MATINPLFEMHNAFRDYNQRFDNQGFFQRILNIIPRHNAEAALDELIVKAVNFSKTRVEQNLCDIAMFLDIANPIKTNYKVNGDFLVEDLYKEVNKIYERRVKIISDSISHTGLLSTQVVNYIQGFANALRMYSSYQQKGGKKELKRMQGLMNEYSRVIPFISALDDSQLIQAKKIIDNALGPSDGGYGAITSLMQKTITPGSISEQYICFLREISAEISKRPTISYSSP